MKRAAKIILLLLLLLLLLILLETTSFLGPKGLIKKYRGVGRRRLGLGAVSVFSSYILVILISRSCISFVEVFRSDGTDTWMTLKHHLAWSLITISGLFTDNSLSVCICISQAKDANFFIFSDRLKLVFIPLLRYFHSVMQNGYMQLQVKFGTSRYNVNWLSSCLHACYISCVVDW